MRIVPEIKEAVWAHAGRDATLLEPQCLIFIEAPSFCREQKISKVFAARHKHDLSESCQALRLTLDLCVWREKCMPWSDGLVTTGLLLEVPNNMMIEAGDAAFDLGHAQSAEWNAAPRSLELETLCLDGGWRTWEGNAVHAQCRLGSMCCSEGPAARGGPALAKYKIKNCNATGSTRVMRNLCLAARNGPCCADQHMLESGGRIGEEMFQWGCSSLREAGRDRNQLEPAAGTQEAIGDASGRSMSNASRHLDRSPIASESPGARAPIEVRSQVKHGRTPQRRLPGSVPSCHRPQGDLWRPLNATTQGLTLARMRNAHPICNPRIGQARANWAQAMGLGPLELASGFMSVAHPDE